MIAIDSEFRDLIPPLTADERAGLETALVASGGARDALVVWNGVLLDGHNRHEICTRLGLSFATTAPKETIADRDDAKLWIIRNQLGRRNLQPFVRVELELRAAPILAARAEARMKAGKRDPCLNLDKGRSDVLELVGDAAKVSHGTVHKVQTLVARAPEALKAALRSGDVSIHAAYEGVKALEKLPEEKRAAIVERIAADPTVDVVKTIADVRRAVFSSESVEWYTPAKYIAAAREVLGGFDLDPASNPTANEIVQSMRYFTQADDGLAREWKGRVWLNPPYGKDEESGTNMASWCQKLVAEYRSGRCTGAIMLVNNTSDRKWFRILVEGSSALCLTDHRIEFYTPHGTPQSPVSANAFFYFGEDVKRFAEHFRQFGHVVERVTT